VQRTKTRGAVFLRRKTEKHLTGVFRRRKTEKRDYRQGTDRVQTGYRQGTDRQRQTKTGYRQGTDRVQAGYRQGTDRVQTGYRQGTDRVQTEKDRQRQTKTHIDASPGKWGKKTDKDGKKKKRRKKTDKRVFVRCTPGVPGYPPFLTSLRMAG
jgi:hypothetical protein